jgi:uncharacterized repeat protein (TIGR01451 family)
MKRAAVVAGCVALVTLGPAAAWAGTLDQQQNQISNGFSEVTGPNGQGPAMEAQTFTAGLTGLLDQVDLYLQVFTGMPSPMTVEIHDVDANGAPGPNVLATTSIAPVTTTDWFSLQFTSPASVTAGTQYAIVAFTSGEVTWGWNMITSGNPYAAGSAYFSPLQPMAWSERTGADQAFRTYVAQQQADLSLRMTGPNMASPHSTITYTLHVTNAGPDVARNTVLTDNLPAGVQFSGANASQGTCTASGSTVTCALGDIPSGGNANVVIQTAEPTTAIINNFASVSSDAADPDATNNDASFATRLTK